MLWGRSLVLCAAVLTACSNGLNLQPDDTGSDDTGNDTSDTDSGDTDSGDTDTGGDSDTDTGSDSDTDTDTGSDSDTDTDTDTGSSGCVDDAREPDDVFGDATALAATSSTPGTLCAADEDWFTIPVTPGCVVDLTLDYTPTAGDLDVYLYDTDGYLAAFGLSATLDEALSYIHGGAAGDLTVVVVGAEDTDAGAYTLGVASTCQAAQTCPTDDLFEQNDDSDHAYALNAFHTDVLGTVCGDEEDWYAIPYVPYGCYAEVWLDFDPDATDLDLYLFDPDGYLAGTSASTDDIELTWWYADVEGPAFIAVDGFDGATGAYTLTTDLFCPEYDTPTCPDDDWFEDNDVEGDGVFLNDTYTYVDAAMCDDDDRYVAVIPTGCIYFASVAFDSDTMDVDLDLYDYGYGLINGSYGETDTEYVSYIADEDYLGELSVYPYSGTGPYSLETGLVCPAYDVPTCPDDDIFEDNETASMPLNPVYTLLDAVACEDDTDFYGIYVPDGCTLDAYVVQDDAGGDVDLYFWDAFGEFDSSVEDAPADESLSFVADGDTWVDVEVYPFLGDAEYVLETEITCP